MRLFVGILRLGLAIMLVGFSSPAAAQAEPRMDDLFFRELHQMEIDRLAAQRRPIEALIEHNAAAQAKYRAIAGKLGVIRAVLDEKRFRADQTFELQGLGVILGDALAQKLGMRWMVIEDSLGTSPCLVLPGTSILLFPQTMISKRIERGETVDVFDMFNWTVAKVRELQAQDY